jgi:hypothetical protein
MLIVMESYWNQQRGVGPGKGELASRTQKRDAIDAVEEDSQRCRSVAIDRPHHPGAHA